MRLAGSGISRPCPVAAGAWLDQVAVNTKSIFSGHGESPDRFWDRPRLSVAWPGSLVPSSFGPCSGARIRHGRAALPAATACRSSLQDCDSSANDGNSSKAAGHSRKRKQVTRI